MERVAVVELVERVCAVGDGCADRVVLQQMIADLRRLSSWCQAGEVRAARLLAAVSSFPEKDLADAAGMDLREAARIAERATVAEVLPQLGDGLAEGDVTGVHVDIVGQALRDLEPGLRAELSADAVDLAAAAASMTASQFRGHVRAVVRRLQADDGMGRFERQRRATRLRMWTDPATGMGRLSGEFDPLTFATIERRVNDTMAALFAERVPDGCPSDPFAKQDHLRALALAALVNGEGAAAGRAEVIVVIDTTAPDDQGRATVDWGIPIEVPTRVLAELVADADVHTVIVRGGIVVHAAGRLDLGRSTRIANRTQRRVLRGLYPTCAIPDCVVRYEHCDLHHIVWWRHGGATDLANLLPLCNRHHHDTHDNNWQLSLTPDRTLTINLPDGQQMTTGPPKRNAA